MREDNYEYGQQQLKQLGRERLMFTHIRPTLIGIDAPRQKP